MVDLGQVSSKGRPVKGGRGGQRKPTHILLKEWGRKRLEAEQTPTHLAANERGTVWDGDGRRRAWGTGRCRTPSQRELAMGKTWGGGRGGGGRWGLTQPGEAGGKRSERVKPYAGRSIGSDGKKKPAKTNKKGRESGGRRGRGSSVTPNWYEGEMGMTVEAS